MVNRDDRYRLTIVQQPRAARACGHGERDRRMIDPPPILQCSLTDYDSESSEDVAKLRSTWNIVHCFLHSVSDQSTPDSAGNDVSQITDPNDANRQLRRLMGTLHMNPFIGIDPKTPSTASETARIGSFYIFHDLSCRQTGLFKLHFQLLVVDMDFVYPGNRSFVVASATSDVFEVFSAKDFPGMLPSTELTKELRRQGATVAVKRGNEGRPGKNQLRRTVRSGSRSGSMRRIKPSRKPQLSRLVELLQLFTNQGDLTGGSRHNTATSTDDMQAMEE